MQLPCIIPQSFYARQTSLVAKELLGTVLIRIWNGVVMAGIIAETEAYGDHHDPASHAYRKKTARNAAMFGPVGHSYIYFIYGNHLYGNHHCLNMVARAPESMAGAVLVRSIIPINGLTTMKQLRGIDTLAQLTNGPGKIGQALHLDGTYNQKDMTQQTDLFVIHGISITPHEIEMTPRIGISKGRDKWWRFVLTKKKMEQIRYYGTSKGTI